MTVSEYVRRFAAPPRPEKATRAGTLLVSLGTIGILISLAAVAVTLAFSGAGGDDSANAGAHGTVVDWGSYAHFFKVTALLVGFWVVQVICGSLVLRDRTWVRVPAIVLTGLALAGCGVASVSVRLPWSVGIALYAAATLWSMALLMSRDVVTWCRRA
jgi:hypothetical protein